MLRAAGWLPGKTVGSHTKWHRPNGLTFSVPDGHKKISPGVMGQIEKALEEDK